VPRYRVREAGARDLRTFSFLEVDPALARDACGFCGATARWGFCQTTDCARPLACLPSSASRAAPLGLPLLVLHHEGVRPKATCVRQAAGCGWIHVRNWRTRTPIFYSEWQPRSLCDTQRYRCGADVARVRLAHFGLLCRPSRCWNAQKLLRVYCCYYLLLAALNSHSLGDLMCRNYVVESCHDEIWVEKVVFA
jgi:hypothetical protein